LVAKPSQEMVVYGGVGVESNSAWNTTWRCWWRWIRDQRPMSGTFSRQRSAI